LDQFLGSGTTLVEAKLLNRNGIGIDINPKALSLSKTNLSFHSNSKAQIFLKKGNAANLSFIKDNRIDFICTHPPYSQSSGGILSSAQKREILCGYDWG